MVYTLMLKDKGYSPYSVPPLRSKFKTLISSEEALIYKNNPTIHQTPPGGVCPWSCTSNDFHARSPYNWSLCIPMRCMTFPFLSKWDCDQLEICCLWSIETKFFSHTSRLPLQKRTKNWHHCRGKHLKRTLHQKGLSTGVAGTATTWTKLYGKRFFANFPALDIIVAPGQRLNKEGWNDTNSLDLAIATCTHSICVAHLKLRTLG